jgi:hypothetical protein
MVWRCKLSSGGRRLHRDCFQRFKLKYDELFSSFTFNINLRRYTKGKLEAVPTWRLSMRRQARRNSTDECIIPSSLMNSLHSTLNTLASDEDDSYLDELELVGREVELSTITGVIEAAAADGQQDDIDARNAKKSQSGAAKAKGGVLSVMFGPCLVGTDG